MENDVLIGTENSHYRKYLTTLGVSIIAASVSAGGLFFQLQADLLVQKTTLEKLTPIAQETLARRQAYISFASLVLPYVLSGFIVVGLIMMIVGLHGWSARQKVSDRKEDMDVKKLEFDVTRLSEDEAERKLEREAEEAQAPAKESHAGAKVRIVSPSKIEPARPNSVSGNSAKDSLISRIDEIQNSFAALVARVFPDRHVTSNVLMSSAGFKAEIDLIVDSKSAPVGYLFEIKYTSNSKNIRSRIESGILHLAHAAEISSTYTKKPYIPVVLVVFEDYDYESAKRQFDRAGEYLSGKLSAPLFVLGVGRLTLRDMTPSDLENLLEAPS